jgi:hypothetical protein
VPIPNLINTHSAVFEFLDGDLLQTDIMKLIEGIFLQIFVANMQKLMRNFKFYIPTYLSVSLLYSVRYDFSIFGFDFSSDISTHP